MKIDDLKLFTTVVELGSFTAAANALDLPRGNVSRRINELEKSLNIPLFFRTTRQLSLTQHGEVYHQNIVEALAALDKATLAAHQISDSPKGKVKLGLLPESDEALQHLLFDFQRKYPEIELDVRIINNAFLEIYPQGLDIAVHGGKLYDSNVIARKVMEIERILFASPEYIQSMPKITSFDDLKNHTFVCYRWPSGALDNHWVLNGKNIEVNSKLSSNSVGFVARSVLHGQGIGFLPVMLIKEQLKRGELMQVLPEFSSPKEDVWLLYPETRGVSRATRLLLDYLLQEVPKI